MRVLLIEDYEPLRRSLRQGLQEAGYAVDATGHGEEGLWYAEGNSYDAIILDLMLPGLDGLSILKRLRDGGHDPPVLILTAKDTIEDRVQGLDLGADDYLVKPFAFEELLARVRALVRRRYERRSPLLQIGEIRIDTARQRVWRGADEVTLTAREYHLLEYLAQRAGQVVSRTEIREHLYDFASESGSNVIDVYVGYLRRKLDRPGATSLIETRRGVGYILTVDR